jgi:hypothetical protein
MVALLALSGRLRQEFWSDTGGVNWCSNFDCQEGKRCQCRVKFPQKPRSKFLQVVGWQASLISRRRERGFLFLGAGRGGVAVIPAGTA